MRPRGAFDTEWLARRDSFLDHCGPLQKHTPMVLKATREDTEIQNGLGIDAWDADKFSPFVHSLKTNVQHWAMMISFVAMMISFMASFLGCGGDDGVHDDDHDHDQFRGDDDGEHDGDVDHDIDGDNDGGDDGDDDDDGDGDVGGMKYGANADAAAPDDDA